MDIIETLDCSLSRLSFDPESLSTGSDRILTNYVQEALQKRYGERVIPLGEGMEVYQRMVRNEVTDTPRSTAQNFGRAVGADLIIVGTVWRHRERGKRAVWRESFDTAGIESQASVAFAICLIDVATGKMLWRAKFAETEGYLFENILDARAFFKKGLRGFSADRLARYGVSEIFKKFPF